MPETLQAGPDVALAVEGHQSFRRKPMPLPRRTLTLPRLEIVMGPTRFDTEAPPSETFARVLLPTRFDFRKKNPMRVSVPPGT